MDVFDQGDPAFEDPIFEGAAGEGPAVDGLADPDDHLWMHDDGRVWDLGPADLDTDADGTADSIARPGPDGLTVYTDSDQDGQVDTISEVRADGSYETRTLNPESGTWMSTDKGRLD